MALWKGPTAKYGLEFSLPGNAVIRYGSIGYLVGAEKRIVPDRAHPAYGIESVDSQDRGGLQTIVALGGLIHSTHIVDCKNVLAGTDTNLVFNSRKLQCTTKAPLDEPHSCCCYGPSASACRFFSPQKNLNQNRLQRRCGASCKENGSAIPVTTTSSRRSRVDKACWRGTLKLVNCWCAARPRPSWPVKVASTDSSRAKPA